MATSTPIMNKLAYSGTTTAPETCAVTKLPQSSPNPKSVRHLVPVTLVDVDIPSTRDESPPHSNGASSTVPNRISLRERWKIHTRVRYKLLETRVNGRLALMEYRLWNCIRRRIDRRRDTKWRNYDVRAWHVSDPMPPSHYAWDDLGNGNVLSENANDTDDANADPNPNETNGSPPEPVAPLPMVHPYSAGSFMGAALSNQPRAPPHAFDEHYRAYSVAMMPRGGDRDNVAYGGKILMPPSALARLTNLNFPSPWMFQLRNPANAAASTHAGVLEFIADEGIVFLPHWMMNTLKLKEGDPIQVTGASLPKGKFVKLQAQETSFVEVSDPKAVLEQALRNFTCLTQGDIIEISYNSIIFGLLVMETRTTSQSGPASSRSASPSVAPGIAVFDTDLEVDFATPKGWKEPPRPTPKPVESMATRLGLDGGKTISGKSTPAGSRPGSSLGNIPGGLPAPDADSGFEAFKGRGETLNGRKTKGKGVRTGGRKIIEVDPNSKIERTDKNKFITTSMLDIASSSTRVDAKPLELEFGQLFFGYPIVPYTPPATPPNADTAGAPPGIGLSVLDSLRGEGNTLSGRPTPRSSTPVPAPATPEPTTSKPTGEHDWGSGGQTLGSKKPAAGTSKVDGEKKKRKKRDVIELD